MVGSTRNDGDGTAPRSPLIVPRRHVLAGAGMVAGAIALGDLRNDSSFASTKPAGLAGRELTSNLSSPTSAMYIVAHPDDTLVFQSPSLLQNIQNGLQVQTIHLTAGDDGMGEVYWGQRELGILASYAQMAGAANNWTTSSLTVGSHKIVLDTLIAQPEITVAFMRLPDGDFPGGEGTALYDFQSLMQLWRGSETSITAVDGSTSYAAQDLINTLAFMMNSFQPQLIVAQDYVNTFGDGDHMDHYATAQFSQSAHALYSTSHSFVGYMGYPIDALVANLSGTLLSAKQSAFYAYGAFDALTCSSEVSCETTQYGPWLQRQYIVGSIPTIDLPIASAGPVQSVGLSATVQLNGSASSDPDNASLSYLWTQTAGPEVTLSSVTSIKPTFTAPSLSETLIFSLVVANNTEVSNPSLVTITVGTPVRVDTNVALLATATASSQNSSTGQLASSAIDGDISGYPNTVTAEWATQGGGVGSWLKLTWANVYTINYVDLFDRPNLNDQITSGTLTFSDGTVVDFGELPNDASSGLTVNLSAPINTTSLLMTVTGVSATTANVGLAEIQAWGAESTPGTIPTASAGPAQTVASSAAVTLNGSASSDPNNKSLTYAWTQTVGPTVTLSSASAVQPTFTAPAGPATLTFSLTVSNGTQTSNPSLVTITVSAPAGSGTNVALLATATASSQNSSTGQVASSAIDGDISGYPNTVTAEWATQGGGVGSWLKLTWANVYTINYVDLFDRPNLNDQITSGTLTFSDGTVVDFGELPNDASSGLTVNLSAPINTTSLLMTVTGVSATTANVGLAEIQAWGAAD